MVVEYCRKCSHKGRHIQLTWPRIVAFFTRKTEEFNFVQCKNCGRVYWHSWIQFLACFFIGTVYMFLVVHYFESVKDFIYLIGSFPIFVFLIMLITFYLPWREVKLQPNQAVFDERRYVGIIIMLGSWAAAYAIDFLFYSQGW